MAIEEIPTQLLNTFLGYLGTTSVLVSVLVGYSILFLCYYGTDRWKDLTFGERLLFGFLAGIPFTAVAGGFSYILYLLALSLRIQYDYNLIWFSSAAAMVAFVGFFRTRIGIPLHSPRGRRAILSFLRARHIPYHYLVLVALVLFAALSFWINGSNNLSIGPFSVLIAWSLLLLTIGYLGCLFFISALTSPRDSFRFFLASISQVFLASRLNVLGMFDQAESIPEFVLPRNGRRRRLRARIRAMLVLIIIAPAIWIPYVDNDIGLLTPQVMAVTVQNGNLAIVTTSLANNSRYLSLKTITRTYFVRLPVIPLFLLSIPNPSNYSSLTAAASACNGCSLNAVSTTVSHDMNVTAFQSSPGTLTIFVVTPFWPTNPELGRLTLTYNDVLNRSFVSIGTTELLNMTTQTSGKPNTAFYQLSISNPSNFQILFDHFFIQGLPTDQATISGTCACPYPQAIDIENQGYPYFMRFMVQRHSDAIVTVKLEFAGTKP